MRDEKTEGTFRSDNHSFSRLVVAQSLGAFNDHFFRQLLIFFVLREVAEKAQGAGQAEEKVWLAIFTTLLFIAPFILFSTYAGYIADALSKRHVTVWVKVMEVILMALGVVGFLMGSYPLLVTILFFMAVQSTFFGPSKYGMLPEILTPPDLARGNGIVELTAFISMILGVVAAGVFFDNVFPDVYYGSLLMTVVAVFGWVAALGIRKLPAAAPARPFHFNPLPELRSGLGVIFSNRTLRLTVLGITYFFSLAILLQINIVFFGDRFMNLGTKDVGYLQAAVAVGIGFGSLLAGLLSHRKVELGLVPLGAIGMAIFSIGLFWTGRTPEAFWWTIVDLTLLGLAGGFFIVPLQTLLQQEAPADKKGIAIAMANLLAFTGMLGSLGALLLMLNVLGLDEAEVFLIAGLVTAAGTVYILALLPQSLFRLVLWLLTNTVYRIRVVGRENLPLHGPALLVANHVSFVDGLLILATTHRFIRFIAYKGIVQSRGLRWLSAIMKVIPISAEEGPRAMIGSLKEASKALEDGEVVCIFAEGQISRTGQLLPFRSGAERILKGSSAPVIPTHLDQVWGSIFSFSGKRFFSKIPRRIPYPVTVCFGKPLAADTPVEEVRHRVQELGSDAYLLRKEVGRSLPWSFVRYARRHPFDLSMVDSSGKRASFSKLVASATHLARTIREVSKDEEYTGLLLPPSVAGAAANVAASLLGKPVVNLNYTASAEAIRSALEQTSIKTVISSRAFLEKINVEVPAEVVFLEDLVERHGRVVKTMDALAAWLLPAFLLRLWIRGKRIDVDDVATVIFSSGSTGLPKGVMQTHHNILSNVQSVSELLELRGRDRILGVLPFFHSTGYTGGLWSPLVTGMVAVYHPNPLDARAVGKLVKQHGVTIIFATPTFIHGYARRCDPGDFGGVEVVIVGAEKLTEPVSRLFRERFGIEPMEGYGCTEASPLVSVNVPDYRERGVYQVGVKRGTVGQPLPGVSVRIVDPDTGSSLPAGQAGMLLVRGPNIMKGYLGKMELTAEVLQDGWYRTGDIARIDEDGFIIITDRLSRFSKIAGEMVPHVKVEEALHAALDLTDQVFLVTSAADAKKGERLVVVHTATEEQLRELFQKLPAQDLPNLWTPRQDSFVRVDEVPRLGTGKVDLKELRQIAESFGKREQ
jgi:acyl-[acyl-carrier-protein]-phospholipid O-acyltransferase/long-chain-fatty-acid--[acyl-carrier-protein] ligase